MDSQGFVPLQVLILFNRLAAIAHDVHTLQFALLSSTELELLSSSERGPLVRARQDPTKWIFPLNERDEIAKHPGPAPSYFQMQQTIDRQVQEYQQYPYPQPYFLDPQYGFPSASLRPQDQDVPPPQVDVDSHSSPSPVLAQFDPQNRKLSGEASVFIPNGKFSPPMTNGDMGAYDLQSLNNAIPTVTEEPDETVENFEDDNLANIILTVNDPKDKPIVPALPVNGVSQKFPNETPEQTLRSPLQALTWRFSDATAATQASNSLSVNSGLSSLTAHDDLPQRNRAGETALTEKNLKKQLSQSGITEYTYPEFRKNAIQSRDSSYINSGQTSYEVTGLRPCTLSSHAMPLKMRIRVGELVYRGFLICTSLCYLTNSGYRCGAILFDLRGKIIEMDTSLGLRVYGGYGGSSDPRGGQSLSRTETF